MLCVCGFVVFFYVMCAPLRALGGPLGAAAVGMVELFSLTPLIKPDALGFVTVSACAAWGGVSVMCQCAAVLEESGLSIRPLLLGKALHALLCALAAAAVWPFL